MSKQQAFVLWIIWFAFLQSALIIPYAIGGGVPEGENIAEPMAFWLWAACAAPILLATALRWLFIPKLKDQKKMLVALIVGLALSEQPIFFALFLIGADYPQNQIAVLMVAVVSIIQFAPSYGTPGYKLEE